ncbi:MAG: NAD(P)/FAD-dependent oxidoreductase [Bacteroidia bacterium]|nr:NAD(P)/FAD-dependent oxidoreductase [Bacteroidia bacterium]
MDKYFQAVDEINTLIIGAGPAGLAVAGRLRKANVAFEILEKTDKIAWSWHNHYDRLCLHTVKPLSSLPHLPFPEEYPLYVPREALARYYENYARNFDIRPQFNQEVKSVKKEGNRWLVKTQQGKVFSAENVVFATGINRVPYSPVWKDQELFRGKIVHSRSYKNPEPFLGQRVLIIGMGNTGAELALDLCESGVETFISVRSPINVVPRDVAGRPVQITAKKLEKLPFGLGDFIGTMVRKIVIGDLSRYGVPMSRLSPAEQLKTTGHTPVIDLGTVAHIKSGRIKILPDVDRFTEEGVRFIDGKTYPFDSVILATGYRALIREFIENPEPLLDSYGLPKQAVAEGDYRGLYFVGFDNYKLGGILGTIYNDSEVVAETIRRK